METDKSKQTDIVLKVEYNNFLLKKMLMEKGVNFVLERVLKGIESDIRFIDKKRISEFNIK